MTGSKNRVLPLAALLLLTGVAGCTSDGQDDLRGWMQQLRSTTKPRAMQLTEPKQFVPSDYQVEGSADPFNPQKLTQALRRETSQSVANVSLIGPELARRKQPLEGYPLDVIRMVGSLNKEGEPTALVSVDKLLYQVRVGNYLGQNYGKIMAINETSMDLREVVQDSSGDWIERPTKIELREASGEKKQ